MDTMLFKVAAKELPDVPVVIDHFHVIQDANRRIDEGRKIEQDACRKEFTRKISLVGQEKLSGEEKAASPDTAGSILLKEFYWMKEQLRRFYRLQRKTTAE